MTLVQCYELKLIKNLAFCSMQRWQLYIFTSYAASHAGTVDKQRSIVCFWQNLCFVRVFLRIHRTILLSEMFYSLIAIFLSIKPLTMSVSLLKDRRDMCRWLSPRSPLLNVCIAPYFILSKHEILIEGIVYHFAETQCKNCLSTV